MSVLLLVDDSRVMLKIVRRAVVQVWHGDEVLLATSGEEAVEIAKGLSEPLDAALIDYNMGGMDGIECAAQLHSLHPSAKLALCTANAQDIVADRARQAGMGVVHKPVTPELLSALFDQMKVVEPANATVMTEDQVDILKEAFNVGVGQSAKSLSGLLGGEREVVLSVPAVELISIAELAAQLSPDGSDVCAVVQAYSGPISGKAHLIYTAAESLLLAREIIGSDTPIEHMSEMESDALREIGNIVLNACVATFGNMFDIEIKSEVPDILTDTALNVLTDFGARPDSEPVLYLRMNFNMQDGNLKGHLGFTMGSRELAGLLEHVDAFLAGIDAD